MEALPSSSGGSDKSPFIEKLIRYGVPIGLCVAGFYFWGSISAFVAETMKNTWKAVGYGILVACTLGPILLYPTFWWMQYKNLVSYVVKWFIKNDPLSFMDRYVEILTQKRDNLRVIKVTLEGRKVALGRKIEQLKKDMSAALQQGQAAIKQNQPNVASIAGSRAQGAKQSLDLYNPDYQRMVKNGEFLDTLDDNWSTLIIKTSEEVVRKREEYEYLTANAKALNQAEEFLGGNTPEAKIYQESIKALEENVTRKIAYMDDFERRSKDVMAGMKVDNQVAHDEGMNMIEEYMKNGNLMFSDDYSKPVKVPVQDVQYEDVSKSTFNLLK